ncbi:metallophosphoesterase [Musicola paradisiaca]|uniref:Bis(5'nucleosyl)-tetraphosphatase, ApaH n=1 Tax=Musicola paradisiaca (strain Ech703) TaxID=579405 RepID=C6C5X8_MUSP7|nr:metallophosphoesterase [Musicola paradisiaca]ACS85769.1 bis(5'nucleosyl)-tetraphosphatase, ApaH [Musicola paradisiaca Ech703]
MSLYLRIDGTDWRNIYVVGDLHGCYPLFTSKLASCQFEKEQDLMISVGDLIDRGTHNLECLELITQKWFRAVQGNHEQMAIVGSKHETSRDHWLNNGGGWFFQLNDTPMHRAQILLEETARLPLVIEVNSGDRRYVIAHADYPGHDYAFDKPIDAQRVVWNRSRISEATRGVGASINGADLFIFGHTPVLRPLRFLNLYYIDTGAVFTGNLTMIQIQGLSHH